MGTVIIWIPVSPQSNDNSCGSYASTDSEKRFGKSLVDLSEQFGPIAQKERKTNKRLCFQQFSADELSPISSVSSSMESNQRFWTDLWFSFLDKNFCFLNKHWFKS